MKKSFIFGAALMLMGALSFQSCSQETNPGEPVTDPVTADINAGADLVTLLEKYSVDGVLALPAGAELTIEEPVILEVPVAIVGDEKAPAKIIAKAGITTNSPIAIANVKFVVADEFKDALIKMNTLPTEGLNDKGVYEIDEVSFSGVTVENLHSQFFWTNKQHYYIKNFTFDKGSIDIKGAAKKTIFDFNSGGFVENLNITNSLLIADETTTWQKGGLISTQSGKKPTEVSSADNVNMTISLIGNTLVNICKGQTSCNYRENNKSYQFFVVKDNIVTDCDKEGQFLVGIGTGRIDAKLATTNWQASGNAVTWGGKDVGAAENSKSGIENACVVSETPAE